MVEIYILGRDSDIKMSWQSGDSDRQNVLSEFLGLTWVVSGDLHWQVHKMYDTIYIVHDDCQYKHYRYLPQLVWVYLGHTLCL